MRRDGEGGDQRRQEQRRHEAEAAHRQAEEDRRRQDEQHAAPGERPDRLARRRASPEPAMTSPSRTRTHREHQREIARPHAERRADFERQGLDGEEQPAADEDRAAEPLVRVDGDGFHVSGCLHALEPDRLIPNRRAPAPAPRATGKCDFTRSPIVARTSVGSQIPSGRILSARRSSVRVLAGRLDDRLPAGDLAFELGLQRRRRRVGVGGRGRCRVRRSGQRRWGP